MCSSGDARAHAYPGLDPGYPSAAWDRQALLSDGQLIQGNLSEMIFNTYSPWAELTGIGDLTLEWTELSPGRVGEYIHRLRLIRLDSRMMRRQARSVLAHELVHAELGDELTLCERVNRRQELRADKVAARRLIDVRDLAAAMAAHEQDLQSVAVDLRVSDSILRTRLTHLHPSERHLLSNCLTEEP